MATPCTGLPYKHIRRATGQIQTGVSILVRCWTSAIEELPA